METLTPIEWQVLRLTASEPENLEQIHDNLRNSPCAAPLVDAARAVRSLMAKGILATKGEPTAAIDEVDRLLTAEFEPTPQGREALGRGRSGPPPGWPEGRVYLGMFQGMMPDVPLEVFQENRREMWGRDDGDGEEDGDG